MKTGYAISNSTPSDRSPLRQPTPRVCCKVVEALRTRHDNSRADEAYVHWIWRCLPFHSGTYMRVLTDKDINRFLTHSAFDENAATWIQTGAVTAIIFPCQRLLTQPLDRIERVVWAHKPNRLPVINIRTVQQPLMPRDAQTTMIYTYLLRRADRGILKSFNDLKNAVYTEGRNRPPRVGFIQGSVNENWRIEMG